jgi:hypothetical protein
VLLDLAKLDAEAMLQEAAPPDPLDTEQKLRELLLRKPSLRTAKSATIIKEAHVRRQEGLAALRTLKATGEYSPAE